MGLFDRFRKQKPPPEMVEVPEGHAVHVVYASPRSHVAAVESGAWIADFGARLESDDVLDAVERRLREAPETMVVWIIGPAALALLAADAERLAAWLRRFHAVRRARGPARGDVAVLPAGAGAQARAVMALLWALDLGSHESARDGAAFVEVHRPDGIVVGMPGPAFTGDEEARGELRTVYEQLDALEGAPETDAAVQGLRAREMRIIEQHLSQSASTPPPTPLSDLLTLALNDTSGAHEQAFRRAFLVSRVGVIASGLPDGGEPGEHRSAAGNPVGLARAATPDGRVMVLACADRAAFVQKFHARFNADMLGSELAALALRLPDCEGILVNSAASSHSIAIPRAQLTELLGHP